MYAGGNNEEYFSKAFPAFLKYLSEVDLTNLVVLLQQHPGAKEKNIDQNLAREWMKHHQLSAQFFVSDLNSEDAQVVADAMLYSQTSMGPQFALSGIPTIQVSHEVYKDILVKNCLCFVATNANELSKAIECLEKQKKVDADQIEQGIGIRANWGDLLTRAGLTH